MTDPSTLFWAALVLASITWYGALVFIVGIKAGRDIRSLIKSLTEDAEES